VILCRCPRPVRNTGHPDRRLECIRCGGVTPHGRDIPRDELRKTIRDAISRLTKLEEDLSWDLATARAGGIRGSGPSDPTGTLAADPRDGDVRAWRLITCRRLERALAWVVLADDAAGEMCLAAETRPPDHVKAPYHDSIVFEGRPDLAEAHAAKARRARRGEGWGAG
jgi:hypothetical protein